jgi:hypothetical protein
MTEADAINELREAKRRLEESGDRGHVAEALAAITA